MATTIFLNCHLWGDKLDSVFTIRAAWDENVDILKSKVKGNMQATFSDNDARDIRLSRLKVLHSLNEKAPVDIKNDTEELDGSLLVSDLFTAPSRGHVHLIVFPPYDTLVSVYFKAWGKPWPSHSLTLSNDIQPVAGGSALDTQEPSEGVMDIGQDDNQYKYTCLDKMNEIFAALNITRSPMDVLVVRKEYELLKEVLETDDRTDAAVVTGQPGIGKTIFMVYLL